MMDTLLEGRRIRVLTVVDILSRFSPIIEADHTTNGARAVAALERAISPPSTMSSIPALKRVSPPRRSR
jgi:hypothetical protein